ncbi:hypothetical protein [Thalassoglobus polymorphus]|uniref:Uncharacterized protein n=1 Tax=Thalassoglobus polymorphus TaxID=2527994 RepID=A0A517QME2_9PLAN|nr:hypothetical protein [Thalassoglobus polymorphus]QDT32793.1 hypothetical protein Mal48_20400 [Thalassoglobus polymorphus]
MKRSILTMGILALTLLGSVAESHAQGLIWSLPEDGTLVRYKGIYKQLVRRPDTTEGDLTLTWDRILEIRSVGKEEAEYAGETVPCRWIEIKVETGKSPEGVLDAGPGGIRMYKLLVPESEVRGTIQEPVKAGRSVFASHIAIVRGYRKIGDEPTKELEANLFQLYPIISLLRHYTTLKEGEKGQTSVLAGDFATTTYTGTFAMETNVYRSTSTGEFTRSAEMPFGVVSWTAKTVTEEKGSTDPRTAFTETSVIEESMQAIAIEQNAESEFLVN